MIKYYLLILMILSFMGCGSQGPTKTINHNYGKDSKIENIQVIKNSPYEIIQSPKNDNFVPLLNIDLQAHSNTITNIIINKSEIISSSHDKTIRVWDFNTLREKRKILGYINNGGIREGAIATIALSENNFYLASSSIISHQNKPQSNIRIYDYISGKLLKILKSHTNVVTSLTFTNDNKYLISGSGDRSVKIWDTSNWNLITTITGHKGTIREIMILKNLDYYEIYVVSSKTTYLYEFKKNNVELKNKYESSYELTSIDIKDDLVVLNEYKGDFLLLSRNLLLKKKLINKVNRFGSTSIKFSSQNNLVYYARSDSIQGKIYNKIFSKNLSSEKENEIYVGKSPINIYRINNNHIIFTENNVIKIFDIKTRKIITNISTNNEKIQRLYFDGKYLGFTNIDKGLKINKLFNLLEFKFNIKEVNYQETLREKQDWILQYKQENGKKLYDTLQIYFKDRLINEIKTKYTFSSFGWYKDYIILSDSYNFTILNKYGSIVALLQGQDNAFSFTIYKDILVSTTNNNIISFWNLNELNNKTLNENYIQEKMNQYKKSKKEIITKGKEIGDPNLYLIKNIKPYLNLVFFKNDQYITWTPDGFFDASKGAEKYIGYHINQGPYREAEFVTVENLYSTFYRPDLIQKALKGESLAKYVKNINIEKLLKDGLAPEVHILTKNQKTKSQDLDLKVQVCPKGKGGYDNLALTINDVPVQVINTSRALKIKKKSKRDDCFTYDQTITLAGGKNKIGFKATNKAGNIESKVDYIDVEFDDSELKKNIAMKLAKARGDQKINNLHILAIAVNKYQDKELQLNYSINDATEMLKTISSVAKPLVNKVIVHKLFDSDVTKENIKEAFKKINSQRDDLFLLYIAGHGITDQYNGNYYYIPYDFVNKDDEKAVQDQGVGQHDFMLGLSTVKALKSLVLLDTCNSGSFVEADLQKATTNKLAKATGRAIISASSKSQVALEGYNDHGVFTYTLLEALQGKGYKDDNTITTNELSDYVEVVLPKITQDKWGYKQLPQKSMYGVDFNLGVK